MAGYNILKDFFTAGMPELHPRHWQAWSLWLAIALFPFFAAGAQGGASYPFAWLVLIGLLFGWRALPELTRPEKQIFIGLAIFFAVIGFSAVFGLDTHEDLRRLDRYSAMLLAFPAYLGIRRFVEEPGRPFLAGLLVAPIGALLFGTGWDVAQILPAVTLQQTLEGFYATIILSNIAGILTILLLSATILFSRNWPAMTGGFLLVLLGILTVIATASRSGILFLVIAMPIVPILLHRHLNRQHIAMLFTMLAVILALFAINPNNPATQRANQAVTTIIGEQETDASTTLRFEMWQDAIAIWKANPILGAGPGSYRAAIVQMRESGLLDSTHGFTHAHSIYFQALATTGTLGFIAMLAFAFALPAYHGWRHWRLAHTPWQTFYASGILLVVLAFMVFGLTEAWFSRNPMLRSYLICLIILLAGMVQTAETTNSKTNKPTSAD